MTETAEKLKLELAQLSTEERAELAYFLIHSLDEESDDDVDEQAYPELTKAQEIELDARIKDSEMNPDNSLTWEEVKTSIKRRS